MSQPSNEELDELRQEAGYREWEEWLDTHCWRCGEPIEGINAPCLLCEQVDSDERRSDL